MLRGEDLQITLLIAIMFLAAFSFDEYNLITGAAVNDQPFSDRLFADLGFTTDVVTKPTTETVANEPSQEVIRENNPFMQGTLAKKQVDLKKNNPGTTTQSQGTFTTLGKGCTTAWFKDEDCDGYGVGKQSDNVYSNVAVPTAVGNIGDLPDADDTDAQVNTWDSVKAKYGDPAVDFNNLRTFLQARGYQANKDIFIIDPVNGDDLTGTPNTWNLPFKTWPQVMCEGCKSGGVPVCLQNSGGCKNQDFNPGDIALFRGGRYTNLGLNTLTRLNNEVSGTSSEPVVIMAFPGEQVIFDDNYGFSMGGDYFIMDGIIVTCEQGDPSCQSGFTSPDVGIHLSTTRGVTLRNVEVAHFNRGIWPFNHPSKDITIEDSVIHDQADEHGIYMSNIKPTPTSNIVVRRNILHHNRRWGMQFNGPTNNPIVEDNIFHTNGMGSATLTNGVQGGLFQNNLVFNNNNGGFTVYADECGTCAPFSRGSSDNLFINNLIYLTGNWNGVCNSQWQPPCPGAGSAGSGSFSAQTVASDVNDPASPRGYLHSGNQFVNNIFITWGNPVFRYIQLRHLNTPGSLIEHNIFYRQSGSPMAMISDENDGTGSNVGGGKFGWSLSALENHPQWGSFINNNVELTNTEFSQLFEDVSRNYWNVPENFDFDYKTSTSKGVNFGTTNQAPTLDLRGNNRNAPPDAGSYEFGATSGCTPGTTRLCPLQLGVCNGVQEVCTPLGTWPGCNYGGNYEFTELSCNDGLDNDCDGEKDWDTQGIRGPEHGDDNCPVSITGITTPLTVCPTTQFTVTCISPLNNINSVEAKIDGVPCQFVQWQTTNPGHADFTCTSGTAGTQDITCEVDLTKSYASGTPEAQTITVSSAGCQNCNTLLSSSACTTDPNCEWCLGCNGAQSSGGGNRCVDIGTCTYMCTQGQCGASCDNTAGGCSQTQTCNLLTCGCDDIQPAITSIVPNQIPDNAPSTITVSGTSFENNAQVRLDGVAVQSNRIVSQSLTSIVWDYNPGDFPAGAYTLTVHNPTSGLTTAGVPFIINLVGGATTPVLNALVPSIVGTTSATLVNLVGSNFDPNAEVIIETTFNYPFISYQNANLISMTVFGGGTPGVYQIKVRNPSGMESQELPLTLQDCTPGETRLCANQVGVCAGNLETCTAQGTWPGCTSTIPNYEPVEISCADNLDNDCDGEYDYDGDGTGAIHGDNNCPVDIVLISAPNSVRANTQFTISCTIATNPSTNKVESVIASIGGVPCTIPGPAPGITYNFDCIAPDTTSPQEARCDIDQSISYLQGSPQTRSVTITELSPKILTMNPTIVYNDQATLITATTKGLTMFAGQKPNVYFNGVRFSQMNPPQSLEPSSIVGTTWYFTINQNFPLGTYSVTFKDFFGKETNPVTLIVRDRNKIIPTEPLGEPRKINPGVDF